MKKKHRQLTGSFMLLDGLLTVLLGKSYVQLWRLGKSRRILYNRFIQWILDWPFGFVRLAGAVEVVAGIAILRRSPFSIPSLYGKIANAYAAIDPGWRQWFYPKAHTAFNVRLKQLLPPGGRILDLGAGTGANLAVLRELNLPYGQYTGVDRTSEMLAHAQERFGQKPNVKFQQLDLITDPLPEGPFDLIISTWVFEHLAVPLEVAQKAWEKLKPGGSMLLLLEVEASSLPSRVMKWIYPVLSARLLTKEQICQFPGLVEAQSFSGPIGEVAVLTLQKI